MFEHSIKVPRHYKIAANILQKVSTEGGSVKTLLYDNKLRHFRTNVLYALILEAIKHSSDIDKIFDSCNLLSNESRLDPWLAKILTAELLFGKKSLPGKSKPEQTILFYKEQFEKYATDNEDSLKVEAPKRPRYVRINTNLLTTSDAISEFQEEGYRFIRCTSGSYDDYLKQIQGLTEYDFTQDYHVKTLFVFAPGTKFHDHQLYYDNKIILQDKATAMAVQLLAPPPGSVVLDMCAAPGMKTTQLAAFMRNQGKIYAVERNEKRYQTLCEFVEKTGSTCVQTLHKDSLDIRRGDYDDVEYILLDPSCSGSGMQFSIHNYVEDERLAKLTSLQEKFLKHAMNAFPRAKKIVYSTCSLYSEENERVITNIVKGSRSKWRVLDVKEILKGQWNNIGSAMYGSIGTRCLYAKPESDLTIGFFLAVLERDPKDIEKALNKKEAGENIPLNRKCNNEISGTENLDTNQEDNLTKKKRKQNKRNEMGSTDMTSTNVHDGLHEVNKPKKKKKKIQEVTELDISNSGLNTNEEVMDNTEILEPSKKKKKTKNKNAETVDLHSLNTNDSNSNEAINTENQESSKKTKKRKTKALLQLDTSTISSDNNFEEPRTESNKPGKNKNKSKTSNDDDNNPKEDLTNKIESFTLPSEKVSKKKRKSDSNEQIEENTCIEENLNPKKKKKKHKDYSLQDIS